MRPTTTNEALKPTFENRYLALQQCARCPYLYGAHGLISEICPDGEGFFILLRAGGAA